MNREKNNLFFLLLKLMFLTFISYGRGGQLWLVCSLRSSPTWQPGWHMRPCLSLFWTEAELSETTSTSDQRSNFWVTPGKHQDHSCPDFKPTSPQIQLVGNQISKAPLSLCLFHSQERAILAMSSIHCIEVLMGSQITLLPGKLH